MEYEARDRSKYVDTFKINTGRLSAGTRFVSFKGVNAVSEGRYSMPAGFSMRGSLEWEPRSSFKSEPTWSVLSHFLYFETARSLSSTICNVILLT